MQRFPQWLNKEDTSHLAVWILDKFLNIFILSSHSAAITNPR